MNDEEATRRIDDFLENATGTIEIKKITENKNIQNFIKQNTEDIFTNFFSLFNRIDGKTYTYFGLFPSLARMPVIAVAPSLYGRLTQLSMAGALVVLLGGFTALHWRILELIRPGRRTSRLEPAVVIFAAVCGSTVVFLASRSIVYHEAILWGIAWSLVAYDRILVLIARPTLRTIAIASACASLAFLSRASVGLGPVIALGLVAGGQLLGLARPRVTGAMSRALDRLGWLGVGLRPPMRPARWFAACIAFAILPVVAYSAVNYSRFDSPVGIPWTKQAFVGISEQNRRVLAENSNTYFGTQFAPTTALQYLRPDALSVSSLFPWVTFPPAPARVIGGVEFIERTVTTSVPASMPALLLLAVIGTTGAVSARFARGRGAAALRAPLIGSALAVIPVVAVAYVGNRYLGDFIPLLYMGALAGFHVLLRRREESETRRWPTILLGVAAGLTVFALWVNFSLAFLYQRLYAPEVPSTRAGALALQYDIDGVFGDSPRSAIFVETLPKVPSASGTTAVVGECDALYWSNGTSWFAVEGSPASGRYRLRVTYPQNLRTRWEPLLAVGPPGAEVVLGVHAAGGRAELGLGRIGPDGTLGFLPSGTRFDPTTGPDDVEFVLDDARRRASVSVNRRTVLDVPLDAPPPTQPVRVGEATTPGVAQTYSGRVALLPAQLDTCEQLLSRRTRR